MSAPQAALRICIVGGGFTGAATAVQLVRASAAPIAVEIVEPREELGRGVAYAARDPDWRLNGGTDSHVLDPADPMQLNRWCAEHGILESDPAAVSVNGNTFIRRHDFGTFVRDQVAAHSRMPTGSTIRHVRNMAVDAELTEDSVTVRLRSGPPIEAHLAVIATGNAPLRLPPFLAGFAEDPRLVANALDPGRLHAIPAGASVLLVGSGLTALDVASTLVRRGHAGRITSVSRRGLRPRPHRLAPPSPGPTLLDRIQGPVPEFIRNAGSPLTARGLLHALRQRIREVEREGSNWHAGFDSLRDVLWKVWPELGAVEKRRALRWLRPWYDMHRFRAPPQNDALVRAAEEEGRVIFRRGRIREVRAEADALLVFIEHDACVVPERFDVVVNCTGLDPAANVRDNPFLAALLDRGLVTADPSGVGFAVDAQCRAIGQDGRAQPRLRMLGPPTAGTFGDPLGVLFIAPQIRRVVPSMLEAAGTSPRTSTDEILVRGARPR